jgi:hypothetical protein
LRQAPSLEFASPIELRKIGNTRCELLLTTHSRSFRRDKTEHRERIRARPQLMASGNLDNSPVGRIPTGHHMAYPFHIHPRIVASMNPSNGDSNLRHVFSGIFEENELVLKRIKPRAIHVSDDTNKLMPTKAKATAQSVREVDSA